MTRAAPRDVAPGSLRAWWLAARPATLSAGAVPVAIGTAVAYRSGGIHWPAAGAALVVALSLQVAANFANDVFDFEKGADTTERLGPTRAAQWGLLSPLQLRAALWTALAIAFAAGSYLALLAGPLLWLVGVAAMISAVAYTAGPYPLGYNGLGDVFVVVFFGFVAVGGTAFVQTGEVGAIGWLSALPAGALATAILVVNNIRDRHTDALAGKRTLAVRWGRSFAFAEYVGLLAVAYLTPVWLWRTAGVSGAVLLPLVTLPFASHLVRRVARDEGKPLNRSLTNTARLMAAFGAIFTLGLMLG